MCRCSHSSASARWSCGEDVQARRSLAVRLGIIVVKGREVFPMKKITVRKAGSVRLTSVAVAMYGGPPCPVNA